MVTRDPPKKHDTDFPEKCTRIPGFVGTARDNPKTMSDAKNKRTKGERTKGDTHKTKGDSHKNQNTHKRGHPQKTKGDTGGTKGDGRTKGDTTKGDTHTWRTKGTPTHGGTRTHKKGTRGIGALRLLDGCLSPTAASICLVAWALLAHSDHRQNACRDFSNREWHKVGRHSCLCCFSRSINNG